MAVPAAGADISHTTAEPTKAGPVADPDPAVPGRSGDAAATAPPNAADAAVRHLRALILAGEHYRQAIAAAIGLGTTESQAISYLALSGDCGQSDLARGLRLTSSAATALVDRLERQGVAERTRHPKDRRRSIIRLTDRGRSIAVESQRLLGTSLDHVAAEQLETVCAALGSIAAELNLVAGRVSRGEVAATKTRALPAA